MHGWGWVCHDFGECEVALNQQTRTISPNHKRVPRWLNCAVSPGAKGWGRVADQVLEQEPGAQCASFARLPPPSGILRLRLG